MKRLYALLPLLAFQFILDKLDAQNPFTLTCKTFVSVTLADDGEASIDASLFVVPDDACCPSGLISYEARLSGVGDFQPVLDLDCTSQGQISIDVRATDCFGHRHICQTFIMPQANIGNCDSPCPACCYPIVMTEPLFVAISENESAMVSADMFDQGSFSPCGNGPLTFSFSSDTGDNLRTLTCDDTGFVPVEVWATDANGVANFAQTFVFLSDKESACTSGACLPTPRVHNALAVSMQYDSSPTCISASDYEIASSLPGCSTANSFTLAFSTDPADIEKCFTCSDLGTQEFDLFIIDDQGNFNSVKVAAQVQAFGTACSSFIPDVPNDAPCDAIEVGGMFGENCGATFYNLDATADANEIAPSNGGCTTQNSWCDDGAENTVWFTFTAPPVGIVTISTDDLMNTQLALWEADDCNGITSGTATLVAANDDDPTGSNGSSRLVAECLTEGQTYFLQVDGFEGAQGGFHLTIVAEGDPCLGLTNGGGQLNCGVADIPPVTSTGMGEWLHLYDMAGNLVASINDMGQELGEVSVDLMIHDGDVRVDDIGTHYLDRNWVIVPAQQPNGNVLVRFYFTTGELAALVTASPLVSGMGDLSGTKISGAECGDYGGAPGDLLQPTDVFAFNPEFLACEFEVDAFSAFYVHGPMGLTLIGDSEFSTSLRAYPNPVSEMLFLDLPSGVLGNSPVFEVLNLSGQTAVERTPLAGLSVPVSGLPQGVYFLKIMVEDEVMVRRFLKVD